VAGPRFATHGWVSLGHFSGELKFSRNRRRRHRPGGGRRLPDGPPSRPVGARTGTL